MSEPVVDLGTIGLARGGHVLIKHVLRGLAPGASLRVVGDEPHLALHLRTWCRQQGHGFEHGEQLRILRGDKDVGRWRGADQAGETTQPAEHPAPTWGLSARGATVEAGGPAFSFGLRDKDTVWSDDAKSLYAQALANQWDPETAIDWQAPITHPPEVEDAVVQVMTYLVENETAALIVPAAFAAQVHPHFREVMQLLAVQAADEARHIEVFTRRALLLRERPALSTVGGQASLKTLIDETDFALASFLLSVLGEGSFLSLLWFLHEFGPDPVTRQVAKLAAQDEARHVAFGLAHLTRHAQKDKALHGRLAMAVERRHAALAHTAGLNEEVFDALVLLAAGSFALDDLARGWDRVQALKQDMDEGRQRRLKKLGFSDDDAAALSSLHTRNFM